MRIFSSFSSRSTTTHSISTAPCSSRTLSLWWPPTTVPVLSFQIIGST
ncbi:hypothetical protein 2016_scaffold57_00113 [Bacteriophage sp.]|nr:hypothetical protein 2016_scaffold57_00113 [Bacteriophage sp.]